MRNAVDIGGGLILTTDNSGGVGEKEADLVRAADRVTARFAARVGLLEQWAAGAEPSVVLLHNFSGEGSWDNYAAGVADIFEEAGAQVPDISGSTESNMTLLQSALAVTMIGRRTREADGGPLAWFTCGTPLVGSDVLARQEEIAPLRLIREALDQGLARRVWPVGSSGIGQEVRRLAGVDVAFDTLHDPDASAGPSTCVLLGVPVDAQASAIQHFGGMLHALHFIK